MTRRPEVYLDLTDNFSITFFLITLIFLDLLGDAFKMQLMSKSPSALYIWYKL